MARKQSSRGLALTEWTWTETPDGTWTLRDIEVSAACFAAQQLERIGNTLQRIENHVLSLGRDGLHEVLRNLKLKARRSEKLERAKRRAKRAAKKTARP